MQKLNYIAKLFLILLVSAKAAILQAKIMDEVFQVEMKSHSINQEYEHLTAENLDKALLSSLTKLTGRNFNNTDLKDPILADALNSVNNLVSQYTTVDNRYLIKFSEPELIKLAGDLQLKPWSKSRPSFLLILVVNDISNDNNKFILNSNYQNQLDKLVKNINEKYAIPVMTPLMDLQDIEYIALDEHFGNFSPNLSELRAKYNVDYILFGKADKINNQWDINWRLSNDVEDYSLVKYSGTGLLNGFEQLISSLYQYFTQAATEQLPNELVIKVNKIDSSDKLNKVAKYLNSLDLIANAQLKQIDGNQASFVLLPTIKTDQTALKLAINSDKFLSQDDPNNIDNYSFIR